ncbi:MAG: hypothetical protein QW390_01125, partial [Candidatus Bathyarchaeia archaeon]
MATLDEVKARALRRIVPDARERAKVDRLIALLMERISSASGKDSEGVEGPPGREAGLGLLPARTVLAADKTTVRRRGRVATPMGLLAGASEVQLQGYEIHMGRTACDAPSPFMLEDGRPDGGLQRGAHRPGEIGGEERPAASQAYRMTGVVHHPGEGFPGRRLVEAHHEHVPIREPV